MRATTLSLAVMVLASAPLQAQGGIDSSWAPIGRILQSSPVDGGGYVRFNVPRTDLSVKLGELEIRPGLALTSWVGFAGAAGDAMAMGDLVVTSAELGPVLEQLAESKVDVTAVHNHLVGEEPQVAYIHFHAAGAAENIARRLDAALSRTGAPRPVRPANPAPVTIDSAAVFRALGKQGRANGPMAQVSFVLVRDTVRMNGQAVVPSLAVASPINIQQVTDSRAVATGDFAVSASQLQPLLRALAAHDITATAVHTHLVGETPQIYFVHFWGDANLPDLLRGLKAALDAVR